MALVCRDYVVVGSIGDEAAHREYLIQIHRALRPLVNAKIVGFEAYLFTETIDIEQEMLDPSEILGHVNGALPVIWVNITFRPGLDTQELYPIEQRFKLKLLGEDSTDWKSPRIFS